MGCKRVVWFVSWDCIPSQIYGHRAILQLCGDWCPQCLELPMNLSLNPLEMRSCKFSCLKISHAKILRCSPSVSCNGPIYGSFTSSPCWCLKIRVMKNLCRRTAAVWIPLHHGLAKTTSSRRLLGHVYMYV